MDPEDRAEQVKGLLGRFHFRQHSERALQDGIEVVLAGAGIPFRREHALSPRDRPDFFVDGAVCVEVKIGGSASEVFRQLERYAEHEEVEVILLVTTRRQHVVPAEIDGKPVMTLCVGGAFD